MFCFHVFLHGCLSCWFVSPESLHSTFHEWFKTFGGILFCDDSSNHFHNLISHSDASKRDALLVFVDHVVSTVPGFTLLVSAISTLTKSSSHIDNLFLHETFEFSHFKDSILVGIARVEASMSFLHHFSIDFWTIFFCLPCFFKLCLTFFAITAPLHHFTF